MSIYLLKINFLYNIYGLSVKSVQRLTLDFAWYCHTYIRVPPWSYANFLSANIEGRGMEKCCFKNQNLKIEMSKQLRMNSLVIPVHFIIWKVTFLFSSFWWKGTFFSSPFHLSDEKWFNVKMRMQWKQVFLLHCKKPTVL